MEVAIDTKFTPIFNKGFFNSYLSDAVNNTRKYVIGDYKREAPVDTGVARNSVEASNLYSEIGYFVTSIAKSKGFPYLISVVEGRGIYKNSNIDDPRSARQRNGRKATKKEKIMFASMAKNGVIFNIKPNKFVSRAAEASKPKVSNSIINEIKKLK